MYLDQICKIPKYTGRTMEKTSIRTNTPIIMERELIETDLKKLTGAIKELKNRKTCGRGGKTEIVKNGTHKWE